MKIIIKRDHKTRGSVLVLLHTKLFGSYKDKTGKPYLKHYIAASIRALRIIKYPHQVMLTIS